MENFFVGLPTILRDINLEPVTILWEIRSIYFMEYLTRVNLKTNKKSKHQIGSQCL